MPMSSYQVGLQPPAVSAAWRLTWLQSLLPAVKLGKALRHVAGARQLLWGDVQSSNDHFEALYSFLADRIVFSKDKELLDQLPAQSRAALLSVVASFLPYYNIPQVELSHLSQAEPRPEFVGQWDQEHDVSG